MALITPYQYLNNPDMPRIIKEAVPLYGIKELSGDKNNPIILEWADEIGGWIGDWYDKDSIPWCGLFVAVCAKRAGFPFDQKALSAKEWVRWCQKVDRPSLGDVMIFSRDGGGHVGLYVGEDAEAYHIFGGNQSNQVCIARIAKTRLWSARRCPWKISQPTSVKPIILSNKHGGLSRNEA